MNASFTYEYGHQRCWECGTRWAVEKWRDNPHNVCPYCGGNDVKKANDRADAAERTAVSLRGAVTKLKRK